jgi:hypothetical protein
MSVPFVKFAGAHGEQAAIVAPAGDVNGDGHDDVIIGAPTARTSPGRYGGAAYVVYGPFVAGTTINLRHLGDRGFVVRGSGREQAAGASVAGAGDVNGDGLGDLLVGAPNYGGWSGRAYVVFGRRRPHAIKLTALKRAGITLRGKRYKILPDRFGQRVAPLGDINHDGLADVGVVAGGESRDSDKPPYFRPGSAYVLFGRRSGGSISMANLGRAGFRIGFAPQMESITSAGDWNADGRADVAVTGLGRDGASVWIVYGHRYTRIVRLPQLGRKGAVIRGPKGIEGPWLGGVASGEDVDGDNRPDVVIGTPWTHSDPSAGPMSHKGGGAWLVRGSRSRTPVDLSSPGPRAWEIARGEPAPFPGGTAYAGGSTALGFVNSDRLADVVLTAGGGLAVVYGNASPTTTLLSALSPAQGFHIQATDEGGFSNVALAGDMNGDGHADLLAGAPSARGADGGMFAGASYLLFSP